MQPLPLKDCLRSEALTCDSTFLNATRPHTDACARCIFFWSCDKLGALQNIMLYLFESRSIRDRHWYPYNLVRNGPEGLEGLSVSQSRVKKEPQVV